jgi:hypothetical protein
MLARGSDCSGAEGGTGRALTMSGVSLNEIIYAQGGFQYPGTDYAKATVGGVSVITFNGEVYNEFYIQVFYWG